jgi:hypothetical protein
VADQPAEGGLDCIEADARLARLPQGGGAVGQRGEALAVGRGTSHRGNPIFRT